MVEEELGDAGGEVQGCAEVAEGLAEGGEGEGCRGGSGGRGGVVGVFVVVVRGSGRVLDVAWARGQPPA